MAEFIIKYWLEVVFTIIISILSFFVKHYYTLYKETQETKKNEFWSQVKTELKDENKELLAQKEAILNSEDAKLQKAIKEVKDSNENLLKAVLDVQKKQFKTDCKRLLEDNNNISFEEFEDLQDEYFIYKSLGGNGPGHNLFELIKDKYSFQVVQKNQLEQLADWPQLQQIMKNNNTNQRQPIHYIYQPPTPQGPPPIPPQRPSIVPTPQDLDEPKG